MVSNNRRVRAVPAKSTVLDLTMVSVSANSICVDLPVFGTSHRSIKRSIINATVGGRLDQESNHVVVQALKDVSFSLSDGDRLALIGRNGAGKTMNLRVLAGICEPTAGSIVIEGTISSLFDTNLLFNAELTGEENIRFCANLLGFHGGEVKSLIEEVEEFTELGHYLDLPIRTYSAGMRVRLSLAIATYFKPDILLLDEGIGAGDMHFFEKAQSRANNLYRSCRIMVLASHSAEMLKTLCNKALWLDQGAVADFGDIDDVLSRYEKS